MVQIEVRVKDKETGLERTLTYKSYLDLLSRYELIGQIDESGNLIEGNPNLQPRHQTAVARKSVAVHADEGESQELKHEVSEAQEETVPTTVVERKKPGRKPKIA